MRDDHASAAKGAFNTQVKIGPRDQKPQLRCDPEIGTKSDKTNKYVETGGGVEMGYNDRCQGCRLFASIAVEDHGLFALCVSLYTSPARTSMLRKLLLAIVVK